MELSKTGYLMENIEKIGCKSGKRNEAFTTEMSPARHMNSSQGNVPPFLQLSSRITSTKGKRRRGTKHRFFIIQTESFCCNHLCQTFTLSNRVTTVTDSGSVVHLYRTNVIQTSHAKTRQTETTQRNLSPHVFLGWEEWGWTSDDVPKLNAHQTGMLWTSGDKQ